MCYENLALLELRVFSLLSDMDFVRFISLTAPALKVKQILKSGTCRSGSKRNSSLLVLREQKRKGIQQNHNCIILVAVNNKAKT